MLRAMRCAKVRDTPGRPPGMAQSKHRTSTSVAPPTPAAKADTVERSMLTQASRWLNMAGAVRAWIGQEPFSGAPTISATRAHRVRAARSLAIWPNWSSVIA